MKEKEKKMRNAAYDYCRYFVTIKYVSTFASIANALLAWSKKGVKRS